MTVRVIEKGNKRIAVIESTEIVIGNAQDALDLMAQVRYENECDTVILRKCNVPDEFFLLRTGLAGEVLQKFTNYGIKLAIIGDYSAVTSGSLRDFIRESNAAGRILFVSDEKEAADRFFADSRS